MLSLRSFVHNLGAIMSILLALLLDAGRFLVLCLRPVPALAAENLFLRKPLAQYQQRQVKPRRLSDTTRIARVCLSRLLDWRGALVLGQLETLIAG
jgi:hypothetical protein